MNVSLLRQWIAALRSRKYKQGQDCLFRKGEDDRFCCLGVLCNIVDPSGWKTEHDTIGEIAYKYKDCYQYERLPHTLRSEIGLSSNDEETLMEMNDSGKKFYEIARWIERRFKDELSGKS